MIGSKQVCLYSRAGGERARAREGFSETPKAFSKASKAIPKISKASPKLSQTLPKLPRLSHFFPIRP